jgi:hypothetical protein
MGVSARRQKRVGVRAYGRGGRTVSAWGRVSGLVWWGKRVGICEIIEESPARLVPNSDIGPLLAMQCLHADTPKRHYTDTFLPAPETPLRRSVSPGTPLRRSVSAATPIRFCPGRPLRFCRRCALVDFSGVESSAGLELRVAWLPCPGSRRPVGGTGRLQASRWRQ